jgi:integrase
MIYRPDLDLWVDSNNRLFIKNEFDRHNPCFIDVTSQIWRAIWKGRVFELNWNNITLPDQIIEAVKFVFSLKLKSGRVAATHIGGIKSMLKRLQKNWPSECRSFSTFDISVFIKVWDGLTSHNKQLFRQIFKEISDTGKFGADARLVLIINKWKIRNNEKTLRHVLAWNPDSGSLTSAEFELVIDALKKTPGYENAKNMAIRILCLILIETVKRPQQILSIKTEDLKIIENKGITGYFLEIPKSKFQTGAPPELWPISTGLAEQIVLFSRRASVSLLQSKYNRLIVWKCTSLAEYGQLDALIAKNEILAYINKLNIISPRTNKLLHITPYRFRHTGATRMAMQGVSRDVIQHILEHDNCTSAQAYIDAIGSDLVPAIERADRNLGDLFKGLNEIFFKGKVTQKLEGEKVFIPIFNSNPMPVGSCSLDAIKHGPCKKQPFTACYDGCPSFLAWKEADHRKALQYVESELERWSAAEGHNARSKAIKDFERLHHAISEVISQIEKEELHASK